MEQVKIDLFEIQATRSECFGLAGELELLFKELEAGRIPDDLDTVKARTVAKLKNRGKRLIQLEETAKGGDV